MTFVPNNLRGKGSPSFGSTVGETDGKFSGLESTRGPVEIIVVAMRSFDALPAAARLVHAIALILLATSVILLMAPAAYHRIVCEGEDSAEFLRIGSTLVISATLPLALGIGCDVGIVMTEIFHSPTAGVGIAVLVTAGFVTLWYLVPLALRRRGRRRPPARAGTALQ